MKSNANYEYLLTGSASSHSFLLRHMPTAWNQSFRFGGTSQGGARLRVHCNGLLCISTRNFSSSYYGFSIYLWNPSIRKFRQLPQGFITAPRFTYIGLGLQHEKDDYDYKVVRITVMFFPAGITGSCCGVEVYSVRLNSWRRINSTVPLSQVYFELLGRCIYFNGAVYWVAREYPTSLTNDFSEKLTSLHPCF